VQQAVRGLLDGRFLPNEAPAAPRNSGHHQANSSSKGTIEARKPGETAIIAEINGW